jgi:hypothetical protein
MTGRLTALAALILAATLPLLLTGCEDDSSTVPLAVCTPVIDAMEPDSGPVEGGTQVTVTGLWVASELGVRDLGVHMAGDQAEVTGVFRGSGCANCDACIADALRCVECERVCRGLEGHTDSSTGIYAGPEVCEEWVSFLTPAAAAAGPAEVVLTNSHGSVAGPDFTYEGGGDDDDVADDDDSAPADDDDSAPADDDDSSR